MKFSELVRLMENEGFRLVKEKGSIRYYAKPGVPRLIRIDFHGSKEVPDGTCHAILKAAGIRDRK
ncbi:MAG: type II toxin-antitoxin system HicA family toxin [Acidobacteria bacterium]|nr:type II toxin-antitoxin system HicA family toxin [Acidobacteriota bacterium]